VPGQGVHFGGAAARWDGDPEPGADFIGVEYGYTATGEIQLEKKEDMKKRSLASPDIADSLALTFAHPAPPDWGWGETMKARILDEDHEYGFFHDP